MNLFGFLGFFKLPELPSLFDYEPSWSYPKWKYLEPLKWKWKKQGDIYIVYTSDDRFHAVIGTGATYNDARLSFLVKVNNKLEKFGSEYRVHALRSNND